MARARGGLISSFRTVSATEASGIFKPNFITALNRDSGFPAVFSMKINSNGTITTFYPGNSGYVRQGGQWAHVITVGQSCTVTWYLWGAAGGSGRYGAGYHAGNGGLTYATTTLQAGTTYYLYVGEGGQSTGVDGTAWGGLGGWPNGGYGGRGDASGAGGGGMTMLSKAVYATNMNDSDILMIAGGGGGTTGYSGHAGHGGGQEGRHASSSDGTWGRAGTQSAGGEKNGAKLVGGVSPGPRTTSSSNDDGGGGGGYYGGGAGNGDGKPGAGGSGYYNTSLTTNQTYTASAAWTGSSTLNNPGGIVSPPDVNSLLANSDWASNGDEKYAQGKITTTTAQDRAHGLAYFSIAS